MQGVLGKDYLELVDMFSAQSSEKSVCVCLAWRNSIGTVFIWRQYKLVAKYMKCLDVLYAACTAHISDHFIAMEITSLTD